MNTTETATFSERNACISCGSAGLLELSAGQFDEGAVKRFIEEDPWGEHPAPFLRGLPWSYMTCQNCGLAFHRYILAPEWNTPILQVDVTGRHRGVREAFQDTCQ